ncbi:bifunctional glycosyltransferase/CDP-glycerol:glycerophosphate glycerophosphotransferase [Actinoplanes sp. N902-109]|uniref:bifunctional glycosyltransferase/CDP-glycerol:glycerophosphate glycerophosphotransferase n=1 Tax=Actinoplanes sp. (strain N902-109) TaxID=649831 RepID=UPI00032949FC|nr:bifunctional glycosyltransferase/CDP-glycerol:glycerophosphate glycerophosphotransferase [Actinoplanes sp. N902-109]AGL21296.1 putative glycerophosphotransferase/ glycosyltransferase [Actinoplanes sp. N902-109]
MDNRIVGAAESAHLREPESQRIPAQRSPSVTDSIDESPQSPGTGAKPLLTVVIPAHDIEMYLDDCLASVAAQTYHNLEIIVVDDGSVDRTGAIADEWARKDSRVTVIHQDEGGPGLARNVGIAAGHGSFLTFADGDDVVPPYAYEMLMTTLEDSGSDFACGAVRSLTSRGVGASPMHTPIFGKTVLRTHVSERLTLLKDRTVWNKVFRRRFWDQHGLVFPEGVVFEDVPVALTAHAMAKTVDVVNVPVYYWRKRETGEKSITQRKTDWGHTADRLRAVDRVSRFLGEHTKGEVKQAYDTNVLVDDFAIVLGALPDADPEFQQSFLREVQLFLARLRPGTIEGLPPKFAVVWHLIRENKLTEAIEVLLASRPGMPIPAKHEGNHRYAELPFLDDPAVGVPRELYDMGKPAVRSRITELAWRDGKLVIRGYAYIDGTAANSRWTSVRVIRLRERLSGRTITLPATPRREPEATATSSHDDKSYDWAGFEVAIDPATLQNGGKWHEGRWQIAVGIIAGTKLRKGRLKVGPHSTLLNLTPQYLDAGTQLTPVADGAYILLRLDKVMAKATSISFEDDDLVIDGVVLGPKPSGGQLRLCRVPDVAEALTTVEFGETHRGSTPFRAVVQLKDLFEHAGPPVMPPPGGPMDRWRIQMAFVSDSKQSVHLLSDGLPTARAEIFDRHVLVRRTAAGFLWLCARAQGPVANTAEWQPDGTLVLTGDFRPVDGAPAIKLRLRGQTEERDLAVSVDGDRWTAALNPSKVPSWGGFVELRPGLWDILVTHRAGGAYPITNLVVANAVRAMCPAFSPDEHREYTLELSEGDFVALRAGSVLQVEERGAYARNQLRHKRTAVLRRSPLREAVLFESFGGRQYSDSPKAIHEELVRRGVPLEAQYLTVRDGQAATPETMSTARLGGTEWYDALATSRYIVTNSHLPDWFERRPGQIVVQTWHGTPLKRIGFDVTDIRHADRNYLQRVEKETPNWSFLVSPNHFSTPILQRAFRYGGEMLESGYPRNDILFGTDPATAAAIRRRIDLPAGKRVVLYAPTWRDDEFYGQGRYKMSMMLDLAAARRALGDDHVLLVRRHPNVVDPIPDDGSGFVRDVSTYPDMADLLSITDVLITDYSSVMFDFANTGRPILLFTYDLEHYRDKLRGFYFDFEHEAPGPLLMTSEDVVRTLTEIAVDPGAYSAERAAFQTRFCDLDDGGATQRVVDRMLELGRQ